LQKCQCIDNLIRGIRISATEIVVSHPSAASAASLVPNRAAPRYTPGGAALHQLVHELERFAREGLPLTRLGTARIAILHSLLQGPKTVSELARERGATRQATLRVVDALRAEGWLERVANPRHRRAPLLRVTPLGARIHRESAREQAQALNRLAESFDSADVFAAIRLLRSVREKAASR
jgi:DNA-binding MarR family transcriptional regulator